MPCEVTLSFIRTVVGRSFSAGNLETPRMQAHTAPVNDYAILLAIDCAVHVLVEIVAEQASKLALPEPPKTEADILALQGKLDEFEGYYRAAVFVQASKERKCVTNMREAQRVEAVKVFPLYLEHYKPMLQLGLSLVSGNDRRHAAVGRHLGYCLRPRMLAKADEIATALLNASNVTTEELPWRKASFAW
jgi:hypothetical protein